MVSQRKETVLRKLLVKDLRKLLKDNGLKSSGKKAVLIGRLMENNVDTSGVSSSRVKKEMTEEKKQVLRDRLKRARESRVKPVPVSLVKQPEPEPTFEEKVNQDFVDTLPEQDKDKARSITLKKRVSLPKSIPSIPLPKVVKKVPDTPKNKIVSLVLLNRQVLDNLDNNLTDMISGDRDMVLRLRKLISNNKDKRLDVLTKMVKDEFDEDGDETEEESEYEDVESEDNLEPVPEESPDVEV